MKIPQWENAPDWAMWLAMDPDFRWFWYENKPTFNKGKESWIAYGGLIDFAGVTLGKMIQVENSLEARPE